MTCGINLNWTMYLFNDEAKLNGILTRENLLKQTKGKKEVDNWMRI